MPTDVTPLLQFQLNGSFNLLTQALEGMSDEEWQARPFTGANLVGFTAWHGARTIDWAVNCVLRGSPELADSADWRDVKVAGALFGAGVPTEAADSVPRKVTRTRVLEYLAALRAQTLEWFAGVPSDEWSGTVDLKASHAAKPEYTTPEVQAEIADLDGIPRWMFLARPGMSHIRVHSGEIAAQLEAVRAAAPA